jgi:hypothetical protein
MAASTVFVDFGRLLTSMRELFASKDFLPDESKLEAVRTKLEQQRSQAEAAGKSAQVRACELQGHALRWAQECKLFIGACDEDESQVNLFLELLVDCKGLLFAGAKGSVVEARARARDLAEQRSARLPTRLHKLLLYSVGVGDARPLAGFLRGLVLVAMSTNAESMSTELENRERRGLMGRVGLVEELASALVLMCSTACAAAVAANDQEEDLGEVKPSTSGRATKEEVSTGLQRALAQRTYTLRSDAEQLRGANAKDDDDHDDFDCGAGVCCELEKGVLALSSLLGVHPRFMDLARFIVQGNQDATSTLMRQANLSICEAALTHLNQQLGSRGEQPQVSQLRAVLRALTMGPEKGAVVHLHILEHAMEGLGFPGGHVQGVSSMLALVSAHTWPERIEALKFLVKAAKTHQQQEQAAQVLSESRRAKMAAVAGKVAPTPDVLSRAIGGKLDWQAFIRKFGGDDAASEAEKVAAQTELELFCQLLGVLESVAKEGRMLTFSVSTSRAKLENMLNVPRAHKVELAMEVLEAVAPVLLRSTGVPKVDINSKILAVDEVKVTKLTCTLAKLILEGGVEDEMESSLDSAATHVSTARQLLDSLGLDSEMADLLGPVFTLISCTTQLSSNHTSSANFTLHEEAFQRAVTQLQEAIFDSPLLYAGGRGKSHSLGDFQGLLNECVQQEVQREAPGEERRYCNAYTMVLLEVLHARQEESFMAAQLSTGGKALTSSSLENMLVVAERAARTHHLPIELAGAQGAQSALHPKKRELTFGVLLVGVVAGDAWAVERLVREIFTIATGVDMIVTPKASTLANPTFDSGSMGSTDPAALLQKDWSREDLLCSAISAIGAAVSGRASAIVNVFAEGGVSFDDVVGSGMAMKGAELSEESSIARMISQGLRSLTLLLTPGLAGSIYSVQDTAGHNKWNTMRHTQQREDADNADTSTEHESLHKRETAILQCVAIAVQVARHNHLAAGELMGRAAVLHVLRLMGIDTKRVDAMGDVEIALAGVVVGDFRLLSSMMRTLVPSKFHGVCKAGETLCAVAVGQKYPGRPLRGQVQRMVADGALAIGELLGLPTPLVEIGIAITWGDHEVAVRALKKMALRRFRIILDDGIDALGQLLHMPKAHLQLPLLLLQGNVPAFLEGLVDVLVPAYTPTESGLGGPTDQQPSGARAAVKTVIRAASAALCGGTSAPSKMQDRAGGDTDGGAADSSSSQIAERIGGLQPSDMQLLSAALRVPPELLNIAVAIASGDSNSAATGVMSLLLPADLPQVQLVITFVFSSQRAEMTELQAMELAKLSGMTGNEEDGELLQLVGVMLEGKTSIDAVRSCLIRIAQQKTMRMLKKFNALKIIADAINADLALVQELFTLGCGLKSPLPKDERFPEITGLLAKSLHLQTTAPISGAMASQHSGPLLTVEFVSAVLHLFTGGFRDFDVLRSAIEPVQQMMGEYGPPATKFVNVVYLMSVDSRKHIEACVDVLPELVALILAVQQNKGDDHEQTKREEAKVEKDIEVHVWKELKKRDAEQEKQLAILGTAAAPAADAAEGDANTTALVEVDSQVVWERAMRIRVDREVRETLSRAQVKQTEAKAKLLGKLCLLLKGFILILNGHNFEDIAEAFGIDKRVLTGLLSLVRGDLAGSAELCRGLGNFDDENLRKIMKLVKGLGPLTNQASSTMTGILSPEPVDLEGMTREEIFQLVDQDHSKAIDFHEFTVMLKYYKLNLSEQKCKELFAECDGDKSGVIDYNEFNRALTLLEEQVANDTINQMGLSKGTLVFVFTISFTTLVFIFGFIFFGISAFTENSEFGAIINSLLPMSCGAGLGSKKEGGDEEEKTSQVDVMIEDSLTKISADDATSGGDKRA